MYYVSDLINNHNDWKDIEIHIIDGQNIEQIQEYQQLNTTKQWNSCIPMTFGDDLAVTLIFYANDWRNWYPLNICDFEDNKHYYRNEYHWYTSTAYTLWSIGIMSNKLSS